MRFLKAILFALFLSLTLSGGLMARSGTYITDQEKWGDCILACQEEYEDCTLTDSTCEIIYRYCKMVECAPDTE